MLCEQLGNRAVRPSLLPEFDNDIACREQVVDLLRTARRKLRDRLMDCGGIK